MTKRQAKPSPILASSKALIDTSSFLTRKSPFNHTFEVDISLIEANPAQARKIFADHEIASLSQSLKDHGQLQPIIVRRIPGAQKWLIVAGERRFRAAKAAGWQHLLAVEHVGDDLIVSLVENLQRVNLSAVEEARGLSDLIAVRGINQDGVAELIGKPKSYVSGLLGVLSLPNDFLDSVLTSDVEVSKNILIEIARIKDVEKQRLVLSEVLKGGVTIRDVRAKDLRPRSPSSRNDIVRFDKYIKRITKEELSPGDLSILKDIHRHLTDFLNRPEIS